MKLRHRGARLGVLLALVAMLLTAAPVSAWTTLHSWSWAGGSTYSGWLTGSSNRHVDVNFTTPGTGCSNIMAQANWLVFSQARGEWVEEGTADCPSSDFFYTGWGHDSGQFSWLEQVANWPGPTTGYHQFKIYSSDSTNWHFYVDGVQRGPYVIWAGAHGYMAEEGLETWYGGIGVSATDYSSLSWSDSYHGNTFFLFSGFEASYVGDLDNHPGQMCGRWVQPYQWSAAENTSC